MFILDSRWHCVSKKTNKTQNPIKPDKTPKTTRVGIKKTGFSWTLFSCWQDFDSHIDYRIAE